MIEVLLGQVTLVRALLISPLKILKTQLLALWPSLKARVYLNKISGFRATICPWIPICLQYFLMRIRFDLSILNQALPRMPFSLAPYSGVSLDNLLFGRNLILEQPFPRTLLDLHSSFWAWDSFGPETLLDLGPLFSTLAALLGSYAASATTCGQK